MKVLFISPFFYPEKISTGRYNTWLVEGLARRGLDITVLASHPIYPEWKVQTSNKQLKNINIIRGGSWLIFPRRMILRRALLEIWFSWFVLTNFFRIGRNADYIISVYPPSLFSALLSFFLNKNIYSIGIVHDLQGVHAGISQGRLSVMMSRLINYVERKAFHSCNRLIFLSKSMAEEAKKNYDLNQDKIFVSYPFPTLDSAENGVTDLSKLLPDSSLNIVYSGALGHKQNPRALYQFMQRIASNNNKYLSHIFSAGPVFEQLKQEFSEVLGNLVIFHDLVGDGDLKSLYERSFIQLIPQLSGIGHGSLPSKLPNILFAGAPVFAICDEDCELADLINQSNCGGIGSTWELDSLCKSFEVYVSKMYSESVLERQSRLKPVVDKFFSLDSLLDQVAINEK